MNYKQPNEWTDIIQAQSYAHIKSENEERSLKNLNKKVYKAELEAQFREKQLQREKEKQFKEIDSKMISQCTKALENYDSKLKSDKKRLQERLNIDYKSDINSKTEHKINQHFSELLEDKNTISNVKSQAERDSFLQRSRKQEKINSELDYLNSKSKFKEIEELKRINEKVNDQQLIFKNIEKVNKRDQDHRIFLEKIDRENEAKKRAYDKVIYDTQNKELKRYEIISSWEKETSDKEKQRYMLDLERKLNSKREINYVLSQQLDEKTKKKEQSLSVLNQERKKIEENLLSLRSSEEKAKFDLLKSQERYKQVLDFQKAEKYLERFNEKLLSPKEKTMNSGILKSIGSKEEIEFRGIPGIHPRVSPLLSSFKRAHRSLAGIPDELTVPLRKNLSQSINEPNTVRNISEYSRINSVNSYLVDVDRHNPITNPLGAVIPSHNNAHLYRGKGLASLTSGNIFL